MVWSNIKFLFACIRLKPNIRGRPFWNLFPQKLILCPDRWLIRKDVWCKFFSVLQIRDVYPGSRICIKEFKYFNPKKFVSKLSEIWSGLFIPEPDPDFLTILDPESLIQGSKRHRIPDPDPQQWLFFLSRFVRLGVPTIELDAQGRSRPSICSLYNWRYRALGNLPHVLNHPDYQAGLPIKNPPKKNYLKNPLKMFLGGFSGFKKKKLSLKQFFMNK